MVILLFFRYARQGLRCRENKGARNQTFYNLCFLDTCFDSKGALPRNRILHISVSRSD